MFSMRGTAGGGTVGSHGDDRVGEELLTRTLRQNKSESGVENPKYGGLHPAEERRNEPIRGTKPE